MPSYQFVLEDEEIWDIAYYLDSLAEPPRETEDEKIGKKIVEEIRANSITSPTLPNKEH
jgi:cytochrome c